jgi:hypothetical protein
MFEKRFLRIFGSKREEVAEDWVKLRNEELHNLHSSPDITTVMNQGRQQWRGICQAKER